MAERLPGRVRATGRARLVAAALVLAVGLVAVTVASARPSAAAAHRATASHRATAAHHVTAAHHATAARHAMVGHNACLVPGVGRRIDQVWRPNILSGIGYRRQRVGNIAFGVRTDGAFYAYRPDTQLWSASVVKAMLMVAYLNRPSIANRNLSGYDRSLLIPMITQSDNNAADTVDTIVGATGLTALANRVWMTRFLAVEPIWGETHITVRDQTKFFLHIDSYIPPLHRYFAMKALNSITPSQRWGIGEVAPKGWKLYFKGGWGSGTGLVDSQVVLLTRGCARVSIAVLTMDDGSHAYGKATLRGMFQRLLKGLPTGRHSRYR
jgi:beta-lactamase class A